MKTTKQIMRDFMIQYPLMQLEITLAVYIPSAGKYTDRERWKAVIVGKYIDTGTVSFRIIKEKYVAETAMSLAMEEFSRYTGIDLETNTE